VYHRFSPWGVKQPGQEADHSPPSIDEVTDVSTYTTTCPCLKDVVLNEACNFTFTFLQRFSATIILVPFHITRVCSIIYWYNICNYVFHTPYAKNMIKQSKFINKVDPHIMDGYLTIFYHIKQTVYR
jgi:hypothetical protein